MKNIVNIDTIHLIPSLSCNLKCTFCNLWKKSSNKIDIIKWKYIIDELDSIKKKGFNISLSGGELFMDKNVFPIIQYASEKGAFISITTNGYLEFERILPKIELSGIQNIRVSIDSLNANKHDYLRGKIGCLKRALRTVELLKKLPNINLIITSVLMGYNAYDIKDILRYVREHSIDGFCFQPLEPPFGLETDRSWFKTSSLFNENRKDVFYVCDFLLDNLDIVLNPKYQIELTKRYFLNNRDFNKYCKCNERSLIINQHGDVRICFEYEAIGNVFQEKGGLESILNNNLSLRVREKIKNCKECTCINGLMAGDLLNNIKKRCEK